MQELLTALDITNKDFGRSFRGYDMEQVDEYLETVASTVATLTREKADLKRELRQAKESLERYEQDKTKLQDTLLMAQKTAAQYIEDSKQRAIEMRREAEAAAEQEAHRLAVQGQQLAEEIRQIKVVRDSFANSFRELLSKYNRALDFNYQRTGLDEAADTVIDYLEDVKQSGKTFLGEYMPQISEDLSQDGEMIQEALDAIAPQEVEMEAVEEYDMDEEIDEEQEIDEELDYRY